MTSAKARNILIVDDDSDTCVMLSELLRGNGYDVCTTSDRDEAATILESRSFDFILLDYMMPGQSATMFLHRVRVRHPHIRVVLLTAGENAEFIASMLGIHDFIAKPIFPNRLLNVLQDTSA